MRMTTTMRTRIEPLPARWSLFFLPFEADRTDSAVRHLCRGGATSVQSCAPSVGKALPQSSAAPVQRAANIFLAGVVPFNWNCIWQQPGICADRRMLLNYVL